MKILIILLIASGIGFASWGAEGESALFLSFGGKATIVAVVDDFMFGVLENPRTKPYFLNVDQKKTKEHLSDFICVTMEGPCQYPGRTMKKAHSGLGISKGDYNALVEVLRTAMDKNNVPNRAQNKLLARLAPMYREIIEK